jgi:hypothetical protein
MRRVLLAGASTLAAFCVIGSAAAQTPVGAPSQGQMAYPLVNPTAYVNNNNNYQAPMLKGAVANPTPGTIVIHINGRVATEFQAVWTSADQAFATAPAPGSLSAILVPTRRSQRLRRQAASLRFWGRMVPAR